MLRMPGASLDDGWHDDPSAEIVGAEAEAVRRVIKHARDARMAPPALAVAEPFDDFELEVEDAAGDIVRHDAGERLPMFTALLGYYSVPAREVTVQTADDYAAMRRECNAAAAQLAARLDSLEAELHAHEHDPHAHAEVLGAIEVLGAAAREEHEVAAVRLMLPPGTERGVQAWRDGDAFCVSICLPAHDGSVRYATARTPVEEEAVRVTGYVDACGVEPADVLGAMPALCGMMACGGLLPVLAEAAGDVLDLADTAGDGSFSVVVEGEEVPSVAAIRALAFACAQGHTQACEEFRHLAEMAQTRPALAAAMGEAARGAF